MKSIYLLITFLLICKFTYGQIAMEKNTISSGGGFASSGTIKIIYTIGEIAVKEQNVSNTNLSEGFIDPNILGVLGISDFTEISNVKVYPNPTTDIINVSIPNEYFTVSLFDLNGKILLSKQNNYQKIQINITDFVTSNYILLIKDNDTKRYKIFKIIKK